MQGQSYLIQRVVLHLLLIILVIWGLHYAVPRIGEYLEKTLIEATVQHHPVSL